APPPRKDRSKQHARDDRTQDAHGAVDRVIFDTAIADYDEISGGVDHHAPSAAETAPDIRRADRPTGRLCHRTPSVRARQGQPSSGRVRWAVRISWPHWLASRLLRQGG